ncbi:Peptidase family M50 [Ruminococcaceae bacterium YRB3002]|nr:Peptidase family M50 [Ruminococcaceae bacterium YRB3002]
MSLSVWSILVVILLLGVLVTIHELGHYWVASLLGIKAYEVSIFVGPKLFSWTHKDCEFSIRCIPFGAYVRFTEIDDNGNPVESDDPDLLVNQKRWKRLIVALAGPVMNIILAIIVLTVMYTVSPFNSLDVAPPFEGSQMAEQQYGLGDTILEINGHRVFTYLDFYYEMDTLADPLEPMTVKLRSKQSGDTYELTLTPVIGKRPMIGIVTYQGEGITYKYNGWEIADVDENQNGGNPVLKVGDYLTHVNGKSVLDEDFYSYLDTLGDGDTLHLTYVRNGEIREDDITYTTMQYTNDRGIRCYSYKVDSVKGFFMAFSYAVKMPVTVATMSVKAIGEVFRGREKVYNMVSGPVGVTTIVSDVVDDVDDPVGDKVYYVFLLLAVISIGLAFTNLLPIPGLDGIQILLIIVEMVMGRPLSKRAENVLNVVGFVMLMCLVIFALASDIIRIIIER